MTTTNTQLQRLLDANPLREPVLRTAIQALNLPPGSQGLDVGCGIGLQAMLLADAVGDQGRITGVDIAPDLVKFATNLVGKAGYLDLISFRQGDMENLPFEEDRFDWAWSADCIGYPVGEIFPVLKELKRVVCPGGVIALVGWSSQQVLPGYPLLEARLNATCSSYEALLHGKRPEFHFLRSLGRLREAGFDEVTAQTFVGTLQAPLGPLEKAALTSLFKMLWGQPQPGVSPKDRAEYRRLCEPASADFILDGDDYCAFFTCSMFQGRVPLQRQVREYTETEREVVPKKKRPRKGAGAAGTSKKATQKAITG
jgi:demethylmenaquinone methyltransferase/2-methoxy-6-polyprenyl-1,4-benzoquinol methylase